MPRPPPIAPSPALPRPSTIAPSPALPRPSTIAPSPALPRPPTIARALASAFTLAFAAACSPGPHVRPFPELGPGFRLRPADDLPGQLERAGRELEGASLHETFRVEGKLRGGATFVAIAAEGRDPFGRETHALRVVTPAAIVLALGPADPASPRPDEPVRLVRHLNDAGAYPSGRDLTGDGTPDVAARAPDGTLALYAVDLLSASRYPVALGAPPTEAEDVSGDGLPDLLGAPRPPEGDPIAPRLLDVAIGQGSAFRDDAPAARAYHRHALEAPTPPASAPPAARLKAAIERSFHAMRAGDPPGRAFQPAADLAASLAPLPDALAASWVRWRGYVADRALRDPLRAPRPTAE